MAKFKVGDKVRVIDNPDPAKLYYMDDKSEYQGFGFDMPSMAGKVVTISEVTPFGYHIKEHNRLWTDEMFSGLATEQPLREFIVIHRDGNVMTAERRVNREVIKSEKATCAPSDTFDFDAGAKLAFDRLMGREADEAMPRCKMPNPAPKPAHRFKVGDRVVTSYGVGYVKQVDNVNNDGMPYCIEYDFGCALWSRSGEAKAAPAPATEPPKFYTGKVVCYGCEQGAEWEYGKLIGKIGVIENGHALWRSYLTNENYISFEDFCERNASGKFIEVKE